MEPSVEETNAGHAGLAGQRHLECSFEGGYVCQVFDFAQNLV
jgi:hypothetical protein